MTFTDAELRAMPNLRETLRRLVSENPDMLTPDGDMPGPECIYGPNPICTLDDILRFEKIGFLRETWFGGAAVCWTVTALGRRLLELSR